MAEIALERRIIAVGLTVAALFLAIVSAGYMYWSLAAPVEVYDNERGLLALLWSAGAFILAVGSLFCARSGRSALFTVLRAMAGAVVLYALAVVVYQNL